MELRKIIAETIAKYLEENNKEYLKWKRKNITLRGMKQVNEPNGVYGSYGAGLYTVPLSNKAMAKEYGNVYFVLNAIPKNPKIVDSVNNAEIWQQQLIKNFCEKHGVKYNARYFQEHTTMEAEMLNMGYDGLIIKGREMVNYTPTDIKYFRTEIELQDYYDYLSQK